MSDRSVVLKRPTVSSASAKDDDVLSQDVAPWSPVKASLTAYTEPTVSTSVSGALGLQGDQVLQLYCGHPLALQGELFVG